ncbi:hypothetical protein L6164_016883 [Bauhinia variegata]|uniref:Uncharacterized protein n=1 Tax=Bauhinia variegata TaxID=167791 RepID=A0ACB9N9T4_BAUVA|nr:hypothetical protein L6164_016883 [Bauhinia variegata]
MFWSYASFEEEFPYHDIGCETKEDSHEKQEDSSDAEYENDDNISYDDALFDRYTDLIPEEEVESKEGDEGRSVKRSKWPQFNEAARFKGVSFELCMEFMNLDVFKQAIKGYSVSRGVKVKFVKNDSKRCRAKCGDPCS